MSASHDQPERLLDIDNATIEPLARPDHWTIRIPRRDDPIRAITFGDFSPRSVAVASLPIYRDCLASPTSAMRDLIRRKLYR